MMDSGPHARRPSRALSPAARFKERLRRGADRVLATEALWSALFVVVMTALLLGTRRFGGALERLDVGEQAPRDVVAREATEIDDPVRTEAIRRDARAAAPEVWIHDTTRGARLVERLRARIAEGSGAGHGSPPAIESQLSSIVSEVMRERIVGNKALLMGPAQVVVVEMPERRESRLTEPSEVLDLDEARARVRHLVGERLGLSGQPARAAGDLAAAFVDANLAFDPALTALRREAAAAAAPPAKVKVPKGQVLVRAGEPLTEEALAALQPRVGRTARTLGPVEGLGLLTIVSLLAFFLWRYTRYHQRNFKKVRNLHALLVLVLVSMLLLAEAMLWVVAEVVDNLSAPFSDPSVYLYLIPFGGGSILIALLANGRIAMVYSGFAAVLFGALVGWDAHALTWSLLTQWAGIYAVTAYRERAALLRAGLVVGGAGAAVVLAVEAVQRGLEPLGRSLFGASLAFVGGAVGVSLLISFALPMLEGLFNVLTDIRLLELSNVNHPLLAQLAVKAPGSYNHSLILGTLAEEAARAIGANSLFCRVAAFYHDIGKIRKADYFVENQRGLNPHDRLAPSMSALVIAAHVKDGIRLAREAGLPEQIVDIIPQHHGTRLMTYFYDKARKSLNPGFALLREEDFRYPGPKPQTREAAIFMLADAVEAAARTIDDPTPNRLKEMIRKLTHAIVLDGQFDECELTFADLERIEEAFMRTLVGIYHHRLDYPGFHFGRPRSETRSNSEARAARG